MGERTSISFGRANMFCLGLMCFFLVYPAFQRLVFNFDGAGRLFFAAFLASIPFVALNLKALIRDPLYCLLLVLTAYMITNGVLKQSPRNFWEWMYVVYPVSLLTLAYCNSVIDYKLTITAVAISMTLSVFMMISLDSTSSIAELDGRFGETFNANDIGLAASFLLVTLCLFPTTSNSRKIFVTISVLIALVAIFISECRTAIGIISFLALAFLFKITNKNPKLRLAYLTAAVIISVAAFFLFKTTSLGQRVFSTTSQAEESDATTGTAWDIMGDRGLQYVEAAPYIASNLPTGIGLSNWRLTGPRHMVFHSEYLVQLCENGLVGFILYLTFLIWLLARVIRSRKWTQKLDGAYYFFIAVFASVVFTDFFFWTYDNMPLYCIYGIVLAKCHFRPSRRYALIPVTLGHDAGTKQ